ncbi:hypothetical protein HK405_008072, partial [Cladochytrium tenue]
NPVDYKILRYGLFFPEQAYPRILGAEGAGEVAEVGPGVTTLRVGDRVFFNANIAENTSATYQQYVTVEEEFAFRIPENLSFEEAASLPVGYSTAAVILHVHQGAPRWWEGVHPVANQFFLVWGGTSVVGQAAIQLAKKAGFTVITTASPRHHAYLRDKLGAAHVFDYSAPDVFDSIRSVVGDSLRHALDAGGAKPEQLKGIAGVLAPSGPTSLVTIVNPQVAEVVPPGPDRVVKFAQGNVHGNREFALSFWATALGLFAKGELVPPTVRVVEGGLAGIEAALDAHQAGKVSGFKFVVQPGDKFDCALMGTPTATLVERLAGRAAVLPRLRPHSQPARSAAAVALIPHFLHSARHSERHLSSSTACASSAAQSFGAPPPPPPPRLRRQQQHQQQQEPLAADAPPFEDIGALPRVAYNLHLRLGVARATPGQQALFPAVLSHRDVVLKDETGSGKTLGVVAAVLSKRWPPLMMPAAAAERDGLAAGADDEAGGDDLSSADQPHLKRARYLAGMIVTPTPELAIQIYGWAKALLLFNKGREEPRPDAATDRTAHLTPAFRFQGRGGGVHPADLPKHVQCLISHDAATHAAQDRALAAVAGAPRLVVGTPRRLLELVESGALDVTRLQTLVLDEVDSLVKVPERYAPLARRYHRQRHPTFAERLVEEVLRSRRASRTAAVAAASPTPSLARKGTKSSGGAASKQPHRPRSEPRASEVDPAARRMQVVVCSATVNSRVRDELGAHRRGWVEEPVLLDVTGRFEAPATVRHHCLVLDSVTKEVRPIRSKDEDNAIVAEILGSTGGGRRGERGGEDAAAQSSLRVWEYKKRFPALADDDAVMMDLIADVCRLERVRRGILFLNANVSVARVVAMLRQRGLRAGSMLDEVDVPRASGSPPPPPPTAADADAADAADASAAASAAAAAASERPDSVAATSPPGFLSGAHELLVITEHMARGLDLPDATHVLVASPPSSPASFLHMAGRVGRFGRPGAAIVLLAGERYERNMIDVYNLLRIRPEVLPSWWTEGVAEGEADADLAAPAGAERVNDGIARGAAESE